MINHSYVKLRKEFSEYLRENKKSQVRSWEKTCGLGPTQRNIVERFERKKAPVELKDLNERTSPKDLERMQSENMNL